MCFFFLQNSLHSLLSARDRMLQGASIISDALPETRPNLVRPSAVQPSVNFVSSVLIHCHRLLRVTAGSLPPVDLLFVQLMVADISMTMSVLLHVVLACTWEEKDYPQRVGEYRGPRTNMPLSLSSSPIPSLSTPLPFPFPKT